jgi:hypothetical protein
MNSKTLFIPSLGYPSVVISRHVGESLLVGGVGGTSHASLFTYSVLCNYNRICFRIFSYSVMFIHK